MNSHEFHVSLPAGPRRSRVGVVVSDLHLFSGCADERRAMAAIHAEAESAEILVLNGDIFDLRWSMHPLTETIDKAVEWLHQLCARHSHCEVHYVLGNHDAAAELAESLSRMELARFHWSPTHVVLGDKLFTHGDLALGSGHPLQRALRPGWRISNPLLHFGYREGVTRYIHKAFDILSPTSRCVSRIHARLHRFAPSLLSGIREIYTGHTHVPCQGVPYRGVRFYNTGSAMHDKPLCPARFVVTAEEARNSMP